MTVAGTSIKAYYDLNLQKTFATQREWILHCVANTYKPSISDITRVSKVSKTSVTGRLNELEKAGYIHKAGTKLDPFTNQTVNWYALGPSEVSS